MGGLHRGTRLAEQAEAGRQIEAVVVAILGERLPPHERHDEVRGSRRGGAGVSRADDRGVVQGGQHSLFALEQEA